MNTEDILNGIYSSLEANDLAKNRETLTTLLEKKAYSDDYHVDTLPETAARNGNLYLLKWLVNEKKETLTLKTADYAAENGYINVLEWLKTQDIICTDISFNLAIENGQNDAIYWIDQKFSSILNYTKGMELACKHGNLEIVKWLHNKKVEATSRAMDLAAGNGHIDIVKFLHINTKTQCTYKAVEAAAKNGDLRMIKWLYKNRKETISKDDLYYAAYHGHKDVVRWLHYNNPYADTWKAISGAEWEGYTEIATWLRTHYTLKHTIFRNFMIIRRQFTFVFSSFRKLICKVKTNLRS